MENKKMKQLWNLGNLEEKGKKQCRQIIEMGG